MPVQAERDPKNSLRFYITVPEDEVGPVTLRPAARLSIAGAERLLAGIKKQVATNAGNHIINGLPKLKKLLPSGSYGDTKSYHVKRPTAGSVPAHHRVGLRITFNDPAHAAVFAKAFNIA